MSPDSAMQSATGARSGRFRSSAESGLVNRYPTVRQALPPQLEYLHNSINSEAFMTALDRILKMIALIRMFGVAPADPTEHDDLVSYVATLRRQLCTLINKHGTRATRNALVLTR